MNLEQLYEIYKAHPRVQTDSRAVSEGCLFFALKGARFDGNQFAQQALDRGAAFAIVDDPALPARDRLIRVKDVLTMLQDLGRYHRRQFLVPVIGITGSNGKTTTKELVSAVLASQYETHFTKGNFNNHIGVPLTLLAMPASTEVAVIEMGANHQGEIDMLCRIAEPSHGLITNIGKAHLEGFGGIEGVKKGKSELYRYLAAHQGMAFINADERFLTELAAPVEKKLFYRATEELSPKNPYDIQLTESQPFLKAAVLSDRGERITINSHLIGAYNFNNMMTAIVLGKYFKVPCSRIKAAVEGYIPSNNRSQILSFFSNTIVLDAYNANPSSMQEALVNFRDMPGGQKIAILGDMLELGEESPLEHLAIARLAGSLGLDQLFLVGPEFRQAAKEVQARWFEDVEAFRRAFSLKEVEQTLVLIKGSRGMCLEKVLE